MRELWRGERRRCDGVVRADPRGRVGPQRGDTRGGLAGIAEHTADTRARARRPAAGRRRARRAFRGFSCARCRSRDGSARHRLLHVRDRGGQPASGRGRGASRPGAAPRVHRGPPARAARLGCGPDDRPVRPLRRRDPLVSRSRSARRSAVRGGGERALARPRLPRGRARLRSTGRARPSEPAVPRAAGAHRRAAGRRARAGGRRAVGAHRGGAAGAAPRRRRASGRARARTSAGSARRGMGRRCRSGDGRGVRVRGGLADPGRPALRSANGRVRGLDLRGAYARRRVRGCTHARSDCARRRAADEQDRERPSRRDPDGPRRSRRRVARPPTRSTGARAGRRRCVPHGRVGRDPGPPRAGLARRVARRRADAPASRSTVCSTRRSRARLGSRATSRPRFPTVARSWWLRVSPCARSSGA